MGIKNFLFIIGTLLPLTLSSQNVTGYVSDNNNIPVAFSTVSLLHPNDSSVVSYSATDKNGLYKLNAPNEGEFLLKVTYIGFHPFWGQVKLQKGKESQLNVNLEENPQMLDAVIIKGVYRGVRDSNDTIKYDTKAFTDGSEVVLGDVLNKLPGIEVDTKGNVKAQGKDVEKILLDGQDYFANNPQLATKNLSADIAETVEVLNNYSEYSILSGFQSNEQTVINVGVNKSKYGKISGNIIAGGGLKDRYNSNANLMQLRSKSMVSFIGAVNNTGDEVFSTDDYFKLQGGINEVIGKSGKFELSEEERRLLFPPNNTYSKTNGLSALNFSYQPKSSFKMNSYVLFNADRAKSEDINSYRYFIGDQQILPVLETVESKNRNNLISGYLKLEYSPDKTLSLAYKGTVSSSTMKGNIMLNNIVDDATSFSKELKHIKPVRTNHQLMLMKALGKNVLLTNARFTYSNVPSDFHLTTDSLFLPVDFQKYENLYSGRQKARTNKITGEFSSSLFYKMSKSYFIQPQIGINYNYQNLNTGILSGVDNSVILSDGNPLINKLTSKNYDLFSGVSLIKNKGFFRFKLGIGLHYLFQDGEIKSKIKEKQIAEITPFSEFSLVFSPKHRLNTAFSKLISSNDVEYFTDSIFLNSSKSYRSKSLVNQYYNHKYIAALNYNYFDSFSDITVIMTGAYEKEEDKVTVDYIQDGITSKNQYVISPSIDNIFGNLYLSKGLGFIPWRATLNGTVSNKQYYNFLSGNKNKIISGRYASNIKLQSNYDFPLNAELFAEVEHVNNNASITQDVIFNVQRYGGKLKYKANKSLYMEAELQYVKNRLPSYNQELFQLNAFVKYDFSKKASIQLRGVNMLHLDNLNWSSVSYTQNYELERHYRKIPGNILLSLKYNF